MDTPKRLAYRGSCGEVSSWDALDFGKFHMFHTSCPFLQETCMLVNMCDCITGEGARLVVCGPKVFVFKNISLTWIRSIFCPQQKFDCIWTDQCIFGIYLGKGIHFLCLIHHRKLAHADFFGYYLGKHKRKSCLHASALCVIHGL